ncbi:MAG: helix-turn-helix domain-containing protein, partial [Anaerolineae bacterium]|nr:helix-turn-helix domain-containing protein [Anaerolineae bacterium]
MDPTALGRYLRETREAKEKTLEDAVMALKIRRPILESFEQGDFAVAESQVQIRGMLRNYARFLGLEEERILEYYAATQNNIRQRRRFGRVVEEESQLQAPRKITDTQPKPPTLLDPPPNRFAWVGSVLRNLALALVSVAAIAVIVFVIVDTLNRDQADLLDGTEQLAAQTACAQPTGTITATYTPTWTPAPQQATATTDFSIAGIGGVQIQLTLVQRSFIRVTVDGV